MEAEGRVIKIKTCRLDKRQNQMNDWKQHRVTRVPISKKLMKNLWGNHYDAYEFINSRILKQYYEETYKQARMVDQGQKGRKNIENESKKRLSLQSNPFIQAFNKIQKIMQKNLFSNFFEYNQRKNARMCQGQINMRKKLKK